MIEQYIPRLIKDLDLGNISLASGTPGIFTLPIREGVGVNISDIPNGFVLKSTIIPFPKTQEEFFASRAMLANLFGQGTHGAVLGLSPDTNMLTLTQTVDYPFDYKEFKEILEDFINTVDFWYDEALSIKQK